MIDRQTTKPGRSGERGAALVVAIAIMTILLAVALTFYAISRQEVGNAINVRNQVQVDLLLDASLAMAQAELNRDFMKNPSATSLDSPAFSLFNGDWAVGKQWALWNGTPLQAGGVPLVNMTAMPFLDFGDGLPPEQMFSGSRSKDWLTIPRFEDPAVWGALPIAYADVIDDSTGVTYANIFGLNSPGRPPFVTPAFYGPSGTDGFVDDKYPLEWIHTWTDVDNDGDGHNDAIWIPLPQDRFFSGGEFQEETGRLQYDDLIDNDLDGLWDESQENGLDEDSDGITDVDQTIPTNPVPDPDEAMELGTFVYWGGNDGLDNDGDGGVDEPNAYAAGGEQDYFLTAPITGIRVYLDFNADGVVPDLVPNAAGTLMPLVLEVLPGNITVQTEAGPVTLLLANNNNVDAIDNDYDMLINDYQVYAYVGPNGLNGAPFMLQGFEDTGVPDGAGGTVVRAIENASANNANPTRFQVAERKSYERISILDVLGAPNTVLNITPNTGNFYSDFTGTVIPYDYIDLRPFVVLTHSGEPVCDLAGRAAITIRDDASAVNVNVAGAHTQNPLGGGLIRALGGGDSPSEYDTRVLPDIGIGLAFNMFAHRMGTPADASQLSTAGAAFFNSFVEDVQAPGYGRVDDNVNILLLALNGVDDDGDGLVDEGLYLPDPGAASFAAYYSQLGLFEGTDDPSELQRFRPLGNLLAENRDRFTLSGFADGDDNDLDGAQNESGELGDLQLQDALQIQDVPGIGSGRYGQLRQSITAYSTDRNVNFVKNRDSIRALNKLDYNFANPQQIAANLILSNGTQAITAQNDHFPHNPALFYEAEDVTRGFAEGLRQGNVHIRSRLGNRLLANTVGSFPADPVLEILQAAVDIVDNRDSDHSRSALTTERRNRVPQTAATSFATYDTWPDRLGTRENIPEDEIMPLGELESYSLNTLGLNRKLEIRDDWWTFYAVDPTGTIPPPGLPGVTGESGLNPEERLISYTAEGNEAIKINELMVRPVRRIEAEMINPALIPTATDPMNPIVTPVVIPANFDPADSRAELPAFIVQRATSDTGWVLGNNGLLGDSTYLSVTVDATNPATLPNRDDILEFAINPSTLGLPPGRYYLTVNTTAGVNGNTVVPQTTGTEVLQYAVKYVNTDVAAPPLEASSIITDVGALIDNFQNIPDAHLSETIPGAPAGWAFLSGQTAAALAGANYFLDGLPVIGANPDSTPTGGQTTYAVTVPPFTSNVELHIAFRLNDTFVNEVIAANARIDLAINFLDFSQEPDHEWVELANTSNDPVNVGGWELEVGIPDSGDDVPEDPFKSKWRIPLDTVVAPGGTVLLAFNKFDHYQRNLALDPSSLLAYPGHIIGANGMGLAASDLGGFISYTNSLSDRAVTVPPIADVSPTLLPPSLNAYQDSTGSVFYRPVNSFVDYIDRDGDGVSSIYNITPAIDADRAALEQSIQSSLDGDGDINNDGLDDASNIAMAARPWDRIVEMQCLKWTSLDPFGPAPVSVTMAEIQNAAGVAAMVLRGGILPDYPEHDNMDNDGDGGYITIADPDGAGPLGLLPVYVPGTLEMDMVDNNLDGVIDERGIRTSLVPNVIDDDGDGIIDEPGELQYTIDFNGNGVFGEYDDLIDISTSEGVDEGRIVGSELVFNWRAYSTGSFEDYTLPNVFFTNRSFYQNFYNNPINAAMIGAGTSTATSTSGYGLDARTARPNIARVGDGDFPGIPFAPPGGFITAPGSSYVGSEADPADWKAFAERRWNPGDNVIVTLYQGDSDLGKVADRVTYREYDVINRTIDDLVVPNYLPADADETGIVDDTPADRPWLNDSYRSMWRPNSMALDFYRSLERKSPLYNGDRFGTENRWQATDGNYDDWSDSLSYFEIELEPTILANPPVLAADTLVNGRARFINNRQERLFRHAMAGSPLRMNAAARKSLNPADLERVILAQTVPTTDPTQFFDAFDNFRTHEDGIYNAATNATKSLANQSWNHSRAQVADRFYQSPGDLMRVPHQTYLHDAVNTSGGADFLRDMTMLNIQLTRAFPMADSPSSVQDIALRGTTLGQDDYGSAVTGNILTAAVNSMSTDSVVLTVGQSEFHPIRPDLQVSTLSDPLPSYINWVNNDQTASDSLLAPAAWAPVFLFDLSWDSGITDTERFPYYPTYVSGTNVNTALDPIYLFSESYFRTNQNAAYLNTALPNHFEDRWSLEKRVAMYVSQVRPAAQFPQNEPPAVVDQRPEGLFIWDGEDGLENGEYELYIGTYIPQMRERVFNAATASAGLVSGVPAMAEPNLLYQSGSNVPIGGLLADRVTYEVLTLDPTDAGVGNNRFNSVFALDVITDPTEARGVAPRTGAVTDPSVKPGGLIHPDDWNPPVEYRAGSDGYIFYGNNAAGGWRPQTVRVTDNFLAVRARNVGDQSDIGIITHIVLAPRKRTAGRVNVNTVQSRIASFPLTGTPTEHQYFNTLLGLPGVVDAATSVASSTGVGFTGPIPAADDVALMANTAPALPADGSWSDPLDFYGATPLATPPTRNQHDNDPPLTDTDVLAPDTIGNAITNVMPRHRVAGYRLSSMIMGGRTEHADGRYYESVGDLADSGNGFDFNYGASRTEAPSLTPNGDWWDIAGVDTEAVYPLSNDSLRWKRFDEVQERLGRFGNLVTTRSDVFEIIMTVEAGYGVDKNGDGFINYRDAEEFVSTAATKASATYERRSPSDQSDGQE